MIARALIALFTLVGSPLLAEDVTLAVASNFLPVAEELGERFTAETGLDVRIAHGSTGQLYAQIANGAPFDIYLAADEARPDRLLQDGLAEDVQVYAIGRLSLVAREAVEGDLAVSVAGASVALADPTVAPYGAAAVTTMERLRLDTGTFRPILLANVGQVATVFATGNADFAFVAATQVPLLEDAVVVDLNGVAPDVRQAAALMTGASDEAAAFWTYLGSDPARAIVAAAGYGVPE